MIKIRWKIVITLSLCLLLLLTACDDNAPVTQMQDISEAMNTAAQNQSSPVTATVSSAEADASSNNTGLTYEATREAAQKKTELLTNTYATYSVQYTLIDHGNIIASGQSGIQNEQSQQPLTKDTMYGIGSVSKMFTTAAVMQLVEQGKINLDTPLVQYIPEFTMKDERYKQITPRMLLNHSSGLNGSSFTNAYLFEDNDTYAHDMLLEQLAGQTLKADPGAYSVYCNDGFTLAEILIEQVSGMDFTSYIHRYITQPLGMEGTKTPLDSPDISKMAGGYHPAYIGQVPGEMLNLIGTGGIYSTAEDLTRFSQVFTGEAEEVLSGTSAAAMAQDEYRTPLWPDDADNSIGYGLGWDSVNLYPFSEYGIKALTKGGDTPLYHASLVALPEQNMAAAIVSSGGSSTYDQLLASEILLQALKEKGVLAEFKTEKSYGLPVKADMPESMLQYSGIYGITGTSVDIDITKSGVITITPEEHSHGPVQFYEYSADGTFHSLDGDSMISFVTEENGRTYVWLRKYVSVPDLGQTAVSMYIGEKLQPQDLPAKTKEAWMQRDGKKYYVLNEKYMSMAYVTSVITSLNMSEQLPGYVLDKRITGPDSAVSELQIPGGVGRDLSGLTFFTRDGVEYLELSGGSILVNEDAVKPANFTEKSTVTIPSSGYAHWYTISDQDEGKTVKVNMSSPQASFAIYDAKDTCLYFSVAGGKDQVTLPAGGAIMFAGNAGTKFEITVQ